MSQQWLAQVTGEGGRDAAQEAPNIFAAIDALAARAASFAERRQRMVQERSAEGSEGPSPRAAAFAAAAAVKQVPPVSVAHTFETAPRVFGGKL